MCLIWLKLARNAALDTGIKKVPAFIYENLTDPSARILSLEDNQLRADLNPCDLAIEITVLRMADNISVPDISHRLGMTEKAVYQHLRVPKMHPKIKEALQNHEISLNQADELDNIPFEEKRKILEKALSENWSVRNIKEYRKKLGHPFRGFLPDARLKDGLFHAIRYKRYPETDGFWETKWETMDKIKPRPHKCEVTTTTQARKQNYVCENDISWAILQPWPLDLDLQSRDVWFFYVMNVLT